MMKTNAARLLDNQQISYELFEYQVDEHDLSAVSVAAKIGQDIEQVFKTLILKGDKTGVFVCIIPGGEELDMKKVARASGNRHAAMVPLKEITDLTGYIRGGCSPIGMKKLYPSYIDETCNLYDQIYVSAGVRGLQFKISPADLIRVISATTGDLIEIKQHQ
jgi:Cys-tRNA(Pro)/Cys-tRNA(Cys) deacylase